VVIAATTASTPVLPDELPYLEDKHFISIGSFKPSMQELPRPLYSLAQTVVIDSHAARHEVGDLIEPLRSGSIREGNIVHLSEVVVGKRLIDTIRITVFKSVGMALYDLYAAQTFVAEAQPLGLGTPLNA
jgi:ornithine cyclodeaminase